MREINPRPLWKDVLVAGSAAGALSLLALALRGRVETGSAVAPVNAPSHWLHGDRALRQRGWSWRYTVPGVLIHHGSALFWALLHRGWRRTSATPLRDAAVTTAAAAVDLIATPRRLTPGFERQLSPRGVLWVYVAFAAGLALASRRWRRV